MIIPTGTDAPLYHLPLATGGLVVANIAAFCWQMSVPEETVVPLMLHYGSFNPIQWVTNNFLHGDIFHLIGNMLFLGLFGLIVEGKIGCLKFLALYLGCGTSSAMIIQFASFFASSGMALGASDAVFAVMAVALFWAPENQIDLVWIIYFRAITFQASILECAGFYIAQNLAVSIFFAGFSLSSSTAHVIGAAVGAGVGYWTLKRNMVDCEGYDLLSVIEGRRGKARPLTAAQKQAKTAAQKQAKSERQEEIEAGMQKVEQYLRGGHVAMAEARFHAVLKLNPHQRMPAAWQRAIIQHHLQDEGAAVKTAMMMEEYLRDYDEGRVGMTLALSRLLVTRLPQPNRALQFLASIKDEPLTEKQQTLKRQIYARAEQLLV